MTPALQKRDSDSTRRQKLSAAHAYFLAHTHIIQLPTVSLAMLDSQKPTAADARLFYYWLLDAAADDARQGAHAIEAARTEAQSPSACFSHLTGRCSAECHLPSAHDTHYTPAFIGR